MTKIEWADEVWNPVTGCTPVSEGCENCYAKRMANRLRGRFGYPVDDPFRIAFHPDRLDQPLRRRKHRRIFVCSMSDLFHENVPLDYQMRIFERMSRAKQHIFIVLTKRPQNMLQFARDCGLIPWPFTPPPPMMATPSGVIWPENVWPGASVENQKRADERIPILLQIPAAVRFVSIEPMLGPLEISAFPGLDWVIVGGETGPGARPMHPDWVRSVRDQCQEAEVPFFFKQWGGWLLNYWREISGTPPKGQKREFPK